MSEESLVPRRLTLLGEAMRPIWQKLEAEIEQLAWSSTPVMDIVATVRHELAQLETAVHRLTERINDLMGEVVSNEAASDSDVYRAVGRFDAPLRDVLASYHGVQGLAAYGDVGAQAGIESHLPAVAAAVIGLAASEHQRHTELVIDAEDVGGRIANDRATDGGNLSLGLGDDFGV